jgi:hypothetical protein
MSDAHWLKAQDRRVDELEQRLALCQENLRHNYDAHTNALAGMLAEVEVEIERQDEKHGPFEGTQLGRSRLAIACLEDEVEEAKKAWRDERKASTWHHTRQEVLQVAAVAIRALRDAL